MTAPNWSLYAMAAMYGFAGASHFARPEFFLRMIPPMIPYPRIINAIAGACEIALAIALLPETTRRWAAWGLIALLIAVFPANVYHFTTAGAGMGHPKWALALRLPLQGVLIYWAWTVARAPSG
jgi:uncharacterized membrane protein